MKACNVTGIIGTTWFGWFELRENVFNLAPMRWRKMMKCFGVSVQWAKRGRGPFGFCEVAFAGTCNEDADSGGHCVAGNDAKCG